MSLLESARINVLRRERDLEYRIYDGRKTAHIALDDVRVGDTVEFAYTLRGWNPVFGNRQFGTLGLQSTVPVQRFHRRLVVPSGRRVHFRNHNTSIEPTRKARTDATEFVWDIRSVDGVRWEDATPSWHDPFARVQWSEFDGWEAVSRWARPMYAPPERIEGPLRALVDRIAAAHSDPRERMLAVLRFVQEDIRYLGVEIGPGSHAPRPPHVVLERRYGDCKDKALLTIAMLGALGIDAAGALVSTQRRHAIEQSLPSPAAFNHVVVRARIDETDYWLDPTNPPQRGSISRLVQADFGYALVLDTGTIGLTRMPEAASDLRKKTIRLSFDTSKGFDQPVAYTVSTVHEGSSADDLRDTLNSQTADELQRNYLNFYAGSYPTISVERALQLQDDDTNNRYAVTENYAIKDFWRRKDERKRLEGYFHAPDIRSIFARPKDLIRSAPLELDHPLDIALTIEATLPEDWRIRRSAHEVKDPAFTFTRTVAYDERKLTISYRYRTTADHVAPARVAAYVEKLDQAHTLVGYTLYRPDKAPVSGAWRVWVFIASVIAGLGALYGLVVLMRWLLTRRLPDPLHVLRDGPALSSNRVVAVGHLILHAPGVLFGVAVGAAMASLTRGEIKFATVFTALSVAWAWRNLLRRSWQVWAIRRAGDVEAVRRLAHLTLLPWTDPDTDQAASPEVASAAGEKPTMSGAAEGSEPSSPGLTAPNADARTPG